MAIEDPKRSMVPENVSDDMLMIVWLAASVGLKLWNDPGPQHPSPLPQHVGLQPPHSFSLGTR